jgi:methanogenic corrinoid protein MtbC1
VLSWCAYCQQFQGELPPFESMVITHGMCAECAGKDFEGAPHLLEHAHELRGIQRKLKLASGRANHGEVANVVTEAAAAGVRPVDIMMGLIAPLLCATGKDWEAATLTVSEEHRFTAFCEDTFAIVEAHVRAEMPDAFADEDGPHADIVLINAPGNHQTLGIRVLALWLISRGRRARIISRQPDLAQLVERVVAATPQIVAISVACPTSATGPRRSSCNSSRAGSRRS